MDLILNGKNLYIVNKKPQVVRAIRSKATALYLTNEADEILEYGTINLATDLYACLFCRQLKNLIFIVNKETPFSASLILSEEARLESVLKMIEEVYPAIQLSEQNAKINGYAASVVEKLQEGVTVTIMETKEEKVKCCPVCGMECDPNIPYCMECGASV